MKKIAFLIIGIILLTTFRGISQNYYMNTVNGTTITTCRGNVMPSWTCAAFGYAAYCNNENYTVTFYSGSPTIPMRISFLSLGIAGFPTTDVFYTEGGYDYLTIIDGPSIGSPTLAALTGTFANTFSYTSTGGYLTLNFKSDVSNTDWGWFAIIGCQPQGCAGNLPAGDFCSSATAICDINGYCGSTNGWYTPDNANLGVNLGGPFCGSSGSIENNAWIKFIPSAASATVNINVANCSSATQGLQAGLFATNCSTFALLTCQSQATYAPVMSLTYSSFVPGQVYYLMIDGYAGNACDYTVSASGGVAVSTISASSNTICNGQSTNLTASAAGSSPTYTWSTGATTSSISVSPAVTTVYSATIASGFCTEVITKTITVNAIPTANAGTTKALNCTVTTTVLNGSGGGSYNWSGPGTITGGTTSTPTVNAPGTFSLTVTVAGCTSPVSTVQVTQNTFSPSITSTGAGSLNCTVLSTTVGISTPTTPVSYLWTGTGITGGATTATATVNQPGIFTYAVTNTTNNCTTTNTVLVTQNTASPSITSTGAGSLNCTVLSTSVTVSTPTTPVSYLWTGTGITGGATTPTATVNQPGIFTYAVTNTTNNCTTTNTVLVVRNTFSPSITSTGAGSLNCTVLSTTVGISTPTTPVSYLWTGTGITGGATTGTATVNQPGIFTYAVTNTTNNCTTTNTLLVTQNTASPSITSTGAGSLNCTVLSTTVGISTPTTPVSYLWTGTGITGGATTATATVNQPGIFTYAVTNTTNNCTTTNTVLVTQNTASPSITSTGAGSLNCTVLSTSVTVSTPTTPVSYLWTGTGITGGATTPTATVNQPGIFTYAVTNTTNNCTTTNTVLVVRNTFSPSITSTGAGSLNCTVLSTTVGISTPTTPVSYLWTGTGITGGATTGTATVNQPGIFTYAVTNTTNNCTTTNTLLVTQNTATPSITSTGAGSLNCTVLSTSVTVSTPTTPVSYLWTGTGITGGATTATATVNQPGIFTYAVTNTTNNCTSTNTVSVVQNTIAPSTPSASITGSLTCTASQVTLTAVVSPTNAVVSWTPTAGICGSPTSLTTTACSAGIYSVIATDPLNNCPSLSSATVNVLPNPGSPIINAITNTGTITCTNTLVTISATVSGAPLTYSWSGSGISGATTNSVVNVTAGGLYTLVVTNSASCTASSSHSIVADNSPVTPTTTASNTITCNTTTVNLTTNAGAGAYTYNWSGPGVVGTNSLSTATGSVGGTYSVIVTNISNGCVGTGTVSVTSNTAAPTGLTISPATFTLSCATPTTVLTATATGATSYTWIAPSGGSIISGTNTSSAGISGAGTYSVIVEGANGCVTAATEATISPNNNAPTFTLSNTAPSITCYSATPSVSVTITSTVPISSYNWSPVSGISGSATLSLVTFTAAGTFTGVITATNGCVSNAIVTVTDDTTLPNVVAGTATAQAISCANPSVVIAPTFTPSSGLTYTWTGPGIIGSTNDASVTVNQNGTYSLSVTNTLTGCASTIITIPVVGTSTPPILNVTSSSSIGIGCLPGTSTVGLTANATPSTGVTYNWSTSANTPTISVSTPSVYSVVVTDISTSCSVAVQYTVENNIAAPSLSVVANAIMPCGSISNTTLSATTTGTNLVYAWTGPSIVSGSNTANPIVNLPGTYSLTVSNPTTGCTSTATVVVINGVPTASFTTNVTSGFAPLTVNFTNQSSGAINFNWNFGNGNSTATNPTNIFTAPGTFSVTLIASSGTCSDTASIVIIVDNGFSIEIPNVFTPNNDGTNDVFTIKSTGVKEITLEIYNRWGQKMYEFTGAKAAWDGMTVNGNEASAGTYFYFIKATGVDGTVYEKQGPVTIFR